MSSIIDPQDEAALRALLKEWEKNKKEARSDMTKMYTGGCVKVLQQVFDILKLS